MYVEWNVIRWWDIFLSVKCWKVRYDLLSLYGKKKAWRWMS